MTTATADPVETFEVPVRQASTPAQQPSRHKVIDAIVTEVGCSRNQARRTIAWVGKMVERAREVDYRTVYPTNDQLAMQAYSTFDRLFPHGRAPDTGSAAAMLSAHVLDPGQDEISILHDQHELGGQYYCTVQVRISVMR